MLECPLCDYFKKQDLPGGGDNAVCGFTGQVFAGAASLNADDYPCSDHSYEEYLNQTANTKQVFRLTGDDWRLAYRKDSARIRRPRAV